MTMVLQAYRFALDPTMAQEAVSRLHCGAQRFAYNWGLARVKAVLGQRVAETSYGIGEEDLTPSLNWSAYSLRKDWNQAKGEVAPWWGENSKEAYSSGLTNLATALGNWNTSKTGHRKGPRVRFPRFKGKRAGLSCRFTTGAFGLADGDRRHVKLPRIGIIRTHESTRKLARHVDRGTARIHFESQAESFVDYSSHLVPGFLQTADYARAVIGAGPYDADEVDRRVAVRLERQKVLFKPVRPSYRLFLDEAVLRRPIGGSATMAAQIRWLMDMANQPNITIHVIPFRHGYYEMPASFSILEFPTLPRLVYVENGNASGFPEPADTDSYRETVGRLMRVALDSSDSVEFLARMAADHERG